MTTGHAPGADSPSPAWLSVAQVATATGHHPNTVRDWITAGKLPAYRIGRRYLIDPEALRQFVVSHAQASTDQEDA